MLQVLLTAICSEYLECTVTGYVTGVPYCHLCGVFWMHNYRICYRCSLLPSGQSILSAQLPDMLQVLLTAIRAEYFECTITGYVTCAPYCHQCGVFWVHSYRICYRCSLLPSGRSILSAQLPDTLQVFLTAISAEYFECTVTGYVTGAPYCHPCGVFWVHSYRICYRCSLLPSGRSILSAQLPDMLQVLLTAIRAGYFGCTVTGYVTGAPYCHLFGVFWMHS